MSWENYHNIASDRPKKKGGRGTFVLALIFCAVVGAVLGGLGGVVLMVEDPYPMRGGHALASDWSFDQVNGFMIGMAVVGAIMGIVSVLKFWPRE